MEKQGTGPRWAPKHFWGITLLIVLFIVSSWAVKHFKKPGQMTVIESQAMDMTAMKPPVGSVPVATEFVGTGAFSAKVRYTGSVVAYTEQNVYPRVDGWLTGLKVYNGDRVKAGQLLAVLDSPDIQSKLSAANYGHAAALQEVPVAQSNLARMRAERNAARKEVQAAKTEVAGAKAGVTAAQRMVTGAEQELKSAQANLKYWRAEFKRQGNLLKAGAVSQQEYDSEQSQLGAAEADVAGKQAKVEEAGANVDAAKAELNNKQAQVQIASDRAAAADAALSGASGEVSQKTAMANMAGAQKATATTFNQYRMIRAPFDGVVTKRFLSPGVLVSPGTAILNVAQIDRVRLQANVAEQDLANIRVGAEVVAHVSKGNGRTIRAVVSSVSPSSDPASRTAVIEAIVDNRGHYLVPGDFVSMEISTSSDPSVITVASSALVSKDGRDAVWITQGTKSSSKTDYYCTMHPEVVSDKPGLCPKCNMPLVKRTVNTGKGAHLAYVTVGKTDGNRTVIISGLNQGDEVIYKGQRYVREGDAVTSVKWGADGLEQLPSPPSGAADMQMPGMGGKSDKGKTDNSMPGMKM